tara:strand:- start:1530 stop:2141 length:612 start_codon:yes stop_codon:yes gene_type:complete
MELRKVDKIKPLYIPIESVSWIYKYKLPLDWCDSFISFASNHIEEKTLKNVKSYKSTGWKLHEKEGFKSFLDPLNLLFLDFLKHVFSQKTTVPIIPKFDIEVVHNNFILRDLWVSWFNENGYTWPHEHTSDYYGVIGSYSFSAYLGNVETSISFQSPLTGLFESVLVNKGDVLFFPSNMVHMSFDVAPNRIICSGNMNFFMKP